MDQIDFSSLPIMINGVWVSGFEGSAEIELDTSGEPYVDRITLTADGKDDKPLVLKRPRLGRGLECDVMFALIEGAVMHWFKDEIDAIAATFHANDCSYGPSQNERV